MLTRPATSRYGYSVGAACGKAYWYALVLLIGAVVLWPLYQIEARGFEHNFQGYRQFAKLSDLSGTIETTVLLGTASVAIGLAVGIALAWAVTRVTPPLRRILAAIPILPLLAPAVAGLMGWIFLLAPRVGYANRLILTPTVGPVDIYSVPFIVLYTGLSLAGFVYLFVFPAMEQVCDSYEGVATVSGASRWQVFRTVVLPLIRVPALYAGGTIILLGMGQFAAPLLLGAAKGINTLTTQMYIATQGFPIQYGLGAALGAPLLVLGVAVIVAQRLALGDPTRFITRSFGTGSRARRQSWAAVLFLITYGIVAAVLPLLALVFVGLSPFWTGELSLSHLTLASVRSVFHQPALVLAITTSLKVAATAMGIVMALGVLCALARTATFRVPKWVAFALDLLTVFPLVLPAALVGFAILLTYTEAPLHLYGTSWIIVAAYVVEMLPYATRMSASAIGGIPPDLIEGARVSGAGPVRVVTSIVWPSIVGQLGAAGALMIVLLFQEFGASLMVSTPHNQVMGMVLYNLYSAGTYPQVAVMALIMAVMAALGMVAAFGIAKVRLHLLLRWLGSRRASLYERGPQAVPERLVT